MKKLIAPLIFFFLFFCFDIRAEEFDINQFESNFKLGLIELKCGNIICKGKWGANRSDLKTYSDNAEWILLAKRISELNTNTILAYFYLTKAAVNLGYYDAAATYLEHSKEKSVNKICLLGSCEGLDMQSEFTSLENQIAQGKETTNKSKSLDAQQKPISAEKDNTKNSGGYVPSEIIYSGGGYVPEATATSKTSIAGSKSDNNKAKALTDKEAVTAESLCKSFGLKKGTKDYAECMLRIREQDITKEKNEKEAILLQQKALDEQKSNDNKRQLELQRVEDEERKKQETEEAMRTRQVQMQQQQQQQYANAIRQCLMKASMLYDNTFDMGMNQLHQNNDDHVLSLRKQLDFNAANECKKNSAYADFMEKQIFSYSPKPKKEIQLLNPGIHCQTRAAGGQIFTDCN